MIALLLKNYQAVIGGLVALVLGTMLVIQKGETRHWYKQSDRFEQLYHTDETTITNVRTAAAKARIADKANSDRVLAEQKAINERTAQSYEARIADARARAERLRHAPAANPGSPGAAPVPGSDPAPGGPNGPASETGLSPDDALTATEQAIQLDELIKWARGVTEIDRQGK